MKSKKQIDIAEALQYFFKLEDWKERILWLGGATVFGLFLYFIAFVSFLVPFIGPFCGCFLFIAIFIYYLLFWIYLKGYTYELVKTVADGKDVGTNHINSNHKERLSHGLRIFLGEFVQNIPTLVLYLLGYGLIFIPTMLFGFSTEEGNGSDILAIFGLFGMIIGYIPLFIAMIYSIIQQLVMYPAAICLYYKEEKVSSMLKFKQMWEFTKKNYINLLLYIAIIFGLSVVFYMAYMISFFLIFLCIGLLIVPLVLAIGVPIFIHIQGHMLGQLCKINK